MCPDSGEKRGKGKLNVNPVNECSISHDESRGNRLQLRRNKQ